MNKKINTFFFSLLVMVYITTSIGIPVYLHYCDGELEDISTFVKKVSCCDGEDEQDADGCCSNVTRHVSFKADFLSTSRLKVDFVKELLLINDFKFFNTREIKICCNNSFREIKPDIPISELTSDIISTCVFRI